MNTGYEKPQTIKFAIDQIDKGIYLLPALQRKFVWSNIQIERLFDSIMLEYPINTFMLWHITDNEIKVKFKFYRFLTKYKFFFAENNPEINTKGYSDFYAIIDGQQRLTALYIGLKGTYAYKSPRKWLRDTEDNMPTRYLYLNLSKDPQETAETEREPALSYDFRFLTKQEAEEEETNGHIMFRVQDIFNFNTLVDVSTYIESVAWCGNPIATSNLMKLYNVIFERGLISSYIEERQDIDTVLEIFIRTNSGGTSLSFSDLLMSFLTANWKSDVRQEFSDLITQIFYIGNTSFIVDRDFILKTCLVLFSDNIKFKVANFNSGSASLFETKWAKIKACIFSTFEFLANLGFTNDNLTAKNAVIPIVYWIYYSDIEKDIKNPIRRKKDKIAIKKWLCVSLLKGIFGSGTDGVLTKIRKVLKDNLSTPIFPYDAIKNAFKDNPTKNFNFDDDFIDSLLHLQKGQTACFPLLALLYRHTYSSHESLHQDHLFPESYFRNLRPSDFNNPDDYNFCKERTNWNSVLNLQLLSSSENESKGKIPLKDWIKREKINKKKHLIPENIDLEVTSFRQFLSERTKILTEELKNLT